MQISKGPLAEAFQNETHVLEQVPPIGHLNGSGCPIMAAVAKSEARSRGLFLNPRDQGDPGMGLEPSRNRFGGAIWQIDAIWQQVHGAVIGQIHDHGAIALTTPPTRSVPIFR